MLRKHSLLAGLRVVFVVVLFFCFAAANDLNAQKKNRLKPSERAIAVFPDEYSELDEIPDTVSVDNPVLRTTLERARQKYLQALILVQRDDRERANEYFENSIEIINQLVAYPDIDKNSNFTDLAQSIIEDYDNFLEITDLRPESSLFMVRRKLFSEIDKVADSDFPNIKTLRLRRDTAAMAGVITPPSIIETEIVIPLENNKYVQKSLDFLSKSRGKRYISKWIELSGRWFPMMKCIADEEGMPHEILYLSMIESGLNPTVVSHAQAVGLWQFIRSTGEVYGLNDNNSLWVDERRDPEKATRAALRHLRDLHEYFGDWYLSLAAYNYGRGGVIRAMRRSKTENPSYWDIRTHLPRETRNYVPLFVATASISINPEEYGIDPSEFNYYEEYKYDTLTIYEPVGLSVVAKCTDTTSEEIKFLNPELVRSITPPDAEQYTLKIPVGTRELFLERFAGLTDEEKRPWIIHKTRKRTYLSPIARKYGVSRKEIAVANGIKNVRSRIRRGATLRIPIDPAELQKQRTTTSASNKKLSTGGKSSRVIHRVRRGESLYSISHKYGVRMANLRNWNNIPYNRDKLNIGDRLIIGYKKASTKKSAGNKSGASTQTTAKPQSVKIIKHTVKSGESLAQIANKYNVTISAIQKTNKLKSIKINPGLVLKIESPQYKTKLAASSKSSVQNEKAKPAKKSKTKASVNSKPKKKAKPKDKIIMHKIKPGQTLGHIAEIYKVKTNSIRTLNNVRDNNIRAGKMLKVRVPLNYKPAPVSKKSKTSSATSKKSTKYYKVRNGDTFISIAHKFGVPVMKLKSLNAGINTHKISINQKIRIK
ncbi:MAG: LysM peptidoglycan-binding domain-containing protein [Candidatus Kapabacteria bacterium]|jgi:membrane-bound lytic murein transglycosylase D|nr:LysM peptidoglycan-binding domain-containing protein [Candidatus Kapabacteria bacterium]